jgi:hypothetical protein
MSDKLHWFKFTLKGNTPTKRLLLEIDNTLLDNVNLWFVRSKKVLAKYQAGDILTFSQRTVEHESFLFPVPISEQPLDVYLSTDSKGVIRLPVRIA